MGAGETRLKCGRLPIRNRFCYCRFIMLSLITATGAILRDFTRSAYDEVMLHCARVGFKP